MPDITLCDNEACHLRMKCRRGDHSQVDQLQSWANWEPKKRTCEGLLEDYPKKENTRGQR